MEDHADEIKANEAAIPRVAREPGISENEAAEDVQEAALKDLIDNYGISEADARRIFNEVYGELQKVDVRGVSDEGPDGVGEVGAKADTPDTGRGPVKGGTEDEEPRFSLVNKLVAIKEQYPA